MSWLMKGFKPFGFEIPPQENGMDGDLVLVESKEPVKFLEQFYAAYIGDKSIAFVDSDLPSKDREKLIESYHRHPKFNSPVWLFSTSGTASGRKWCIHDETTILESILNYQGAFDDRNLRAVILLPLFHVGGFLAFMRAMYNGIHIQFEDYRSIKYKSSESPAVISLVPTQLKRMIESENGLLFLKNCSRIFIGGSAISEELFHQIKRLKLPVVLSYGLTETAAMVATATIDQVYDYNQIIYHPLDGVKMSLSTPNRLIQVESKVLFKGYLGLDETITQPWVTADRGKWQGKDSFLLRGRSDRVVISGGENISIERIEKVVSQISGVLDCAAFGEKDPDWGERIALAVVEGYESKNLMQKIRNELTPYEVPKSIYKVQAIPRNLLGKVDWEKLRILCSESNLQ